MKMASRSIDLISKKKFGRAARFFCLSLPFFAVVLHDYNAVCTD